jgi:putative ribosome biogenesis GTPase RsgA
MPWAANLKQKTKDIEGQSGVGKTSQVQRTLFHANTIRKCSFSNHTILYSIVIYSDEK